MEEKGRRRRRRRRSLVEGKRALYSSNRPSDELLETTKKSVELNVLRSPFSSDEREFLSSISGCKSPP